MRQKSKYLDILIVVIIILAIIFGTGGYAVSQLADGVHVTRVVNGSNPAQYLPDDYFTVKLDYTVTGLQYAISIVENLPAGWEIVNSSKPFEPLAPNNYTWNISSPLTGVSSGTIYYLVHIPDNATDGDYQINGGAAWFSSYTAVKNIDPTDTAQSESTNITVASTEGNGPCVWISDVTELNGDGDRHLEAGETVQFNYDIWDPSGIDSSYQVQVDESNATRSDVPGQYHISGTANAPLASKAAPDDLLHSITIIATDLSNHDLQTVFSLPVYVPNYHYTVWASGTWNGFTAESAAFEPYNSPADGGWTYLYGGNPVDVPAVDIFYNGPPHINRNVTGSLSNIPFYSLFGIGGISGEASASVDMTPRGVSIPYNTYPVYSEYLGANDVSASFNGTTPMYFKTFHVMLLNLSRIPDKLDLTDMNSIIAGLKNLTPEDIKECEMRGIDKSADLGSCEFNLDASDIPELNNMSQGIYAIIVMDYGMPNMPCLVSAAPFIVTKNGLETTQVGTASPGDPVVLNENLVGGQASGAEYIYIAAMVPEGDFSGALTVNVPGDGSVSGTTFSLYGLSMTESGTITSDGTDAGTSLEVHGMTGDDYVLHSEDLKNTTKLKDILMSEFNESNVSVTVSDRTMQANLDMSLMTKDTMPTGNYIVTSVVIDRNSGKVAAVNQTTITLGQMSYTYNLVKDWNLISIPYNLTDNSISGTIPADVISHIVNIWGWNETVQNWMYYSPNPEPYFQTHYPAITKLESGRAYWVEMTDAESFTITGTVPDSAPGSPVSLVPLWSFVGPTGPTGSTADILYPSNVVNVWGWDESVQNWKYYSPNPETYFQTHYPALTSIDIGHGYWVELPEV